MVKAAVTLNKSHQHLRGMTSSAKVLGQLEANNIGLRNLPGEGTPAFLANVLFDGGSDGRLFKAEVSQAVNLPKLESQHMRLTTATGTTWKNFDRSEISFIGQRMGKKEIINISAIAIDKIGREKSDLTDNVTRVSRLYIFTVELHDHLIKQADASEEEIQMIVGQRSAQLLLEEIRPAQVKVRQPWIMDTIQC